MKHWIFAISLGFSGGAFAKTPSLVSSPLSPQQLAQKIADDINHLDTYESYWKQQKVKDPEAYATLSNFLVHHGKDKVPSAEASGKVVFFFENEKGKFQISQLEILKVQPLEISFGGKAYKVKTMADAILLMETRPELKKISQQKVRQPEAKVSLWSWLFGEVAVAAPAAAEAPPASVVPPAAPAAVASAMVVNPIPLQKETKFPGLVFDVNKGQTGNAIVEALSATNVPLNCTKFLGGELTEIPVGGDNVFKIRYSADSDYIEKFTFPNYKKDLHMEFRRDKGEDIKGKANEESWIICPEPTCQKQKVKAYTKEKLLGDPSMVSMEETPAQKSAKAEFSKYESEYKRVAATFKKTTLEETLGGRITNFAEGKRYKYSPDSTIETVASRLVDSKEWDEIAKSLRTMLKGSAETLSKQGTVAPEKSYTDEQLKSNLRCLVYERFQEYELYLKKCNFESVRGFQLAANPKLVNTIIDRVAEKLRPLALPTKNSRASLGAEDLIRPNAREDLFFLSKADADKIAPLMEPSFALLEICTQIQSFASAKLGRTDSKSVSELTAECLNRPVYEKRLASLKEKIGREAPNTGLAEFDAGPVAAVNFAGAIAQCCKSAPCLRGIEAAKRMRAGTFDEKGATEKTETKTRSKRGQH